VEKVQQSVVDRMHVAGSEVVQEGVDHIEGGTKVCTSLKYSTMSRSPV
jgi:hypothetical protein